MSIEDVGEFLRAAATEFESRVAFDPARAAEQLTTRLEALLEQAKPRRTRLEAARALLEGPPVTEETRPSLKGLPSGVRIEGRAVSLTNVRISTRDGDVLVTSYDAGASDMSGLPPDVPAAVALGERLYRLDRVATIKRGDPVVLRAGGEVDSDLWQTLAEAIDAFEELENPSQKHVEQLEWLQRTFAAGRAVVDAAAEVLSAHDHVISYVGQVIE